MRIVLVLLMITYGVVVAQDTLTYQTVEKLSLNYYNANAYKQLLTLTDKAEQHQIDYYYLRYRTGAAAYMNQRYNKAIYHFQKALAFNCIDSLSKTYLYYSYLNLNHTLQAQQVYTSMTPAQQTTFGTQKNHFIKSIDFNYAQNTNATYPQQIAETFDNTEVRPNRALTQKYSFVNVGVHHSILKSMSMVHSFTNLNSYNTTLLGGKEYTTTTVQNQYYTNLQKQIGSHFQVALGLHAFWIKANAFELSPTNPFVYQVKDIQLQQLLMHYSVGYKTPLYKLNYVGSSANFSNQKQIQQSVSAIIYPYGNLNVYFETDVTALHESDSTQNKWYPIVKQKAGIRIFKLPVWVEGFYATGHLQNYAEENGYYVYNALDAGNYKWGATSYISLLKQHLTFSLTYSNESKIGAKSVDIMGNPVDLINFKPINTSYQLLNINVNYKF